MQLDEFKSVEKEKVETGTDTETCCTEKHVVMPELPVADPNYELQQDIMDAVPDGYVVVRTDRAEYSLVSNPGTAQQAVDVFTSKKAIMAALAEWG